MHRSKLKQSIPLLSFLFLLNTSFTPKPIYFEGVIVYEHMFESSDPHADVERMAMMFGTRSEFQFKQGNYVQVFNGTLLKSNLYIKEENRIYMQDSNSDTLHYLDCSKPNEVITASSISSNGDIVLDRVCDVLSITSNTLDGKFYRSAEYYFSKELRIDPAWHKATRFGSHDKLYGQMGALPLKIVIERGGVKMTMAAIAVTNQPIDREVLRLAQGVAIAPQRQ